MGRHNPKENTEFEDFFCIAYYVNFGSFYEFWIEGYFGNFMFSVDIWDI